MITLEDSLSDGDGPHIFLKRPPASLPSTNNLLNSQSAINRRKFVGVVIPPPSPFLLFTKQRDLSLPVDDSLTTPSLTTQSSCSETDPSSPDDSAFHMNSPELRAPEDDLLLDSFHLERRPRSQSPHPPPLASTSRLPPSSERHSPPSSSPLSSPIASSSVLRSPSPKVEEHEEEEGAPLLPQPENSNNLKKTYQSTCHYDKVRSDRPKMKCSSDHCNTIWCDRCIANHFTGPDHPPFVAGAFFICPLCRNLCVCAKCRRARTQGPKEKGKDKERPKPLPKPKALPTRRKRSSSESSDDLFAETVVENSNAAASGGGELWVGVMTRRESAGEGIKASTTLHKIMEDNIKAYKERNSFVPATELRRRARSLSASGSVAAFSEVSSLADEEEDLLFIDEMERRGSEQARDNPFALLPYTTLELAVDSRDWGEEGSPEPSAEMDWIPELGREAGAKASPRFNEGPKRKRRRLRMEERRAKGLPPDPDLLSQDGSGDEFEEEGFADLAAKEEGSTNPFSPSSSPLRPSISPSLLNPPREPSLQLDFNPPSPVPTTFSTTAPSDPQAEPQLQSQPPPSPPPTLPSLPNPRAGPILPNAASRAVRTVNEIRRAAMNINIAPFSQAPPFSITRAPIDVPTFAPPAGELVKLADYSEEEDELVSSPFLSGPLATFGGAEGTFDVETRQAQNQETEVMETVENLHGDYHENGGSFGTQVSQVSTIYQQSTPQYPLPTQTVSSHISTFYSRADDRFAPVYPPPQYYRPPPPASIPTPSSSSASAWSNPLISHPTYSSGLNRSPPRAGPIHPPSSSHYHHTTYSHSITPSILPRPYSYSSHTSAPSYPSPPSQETNFNPLAIPDAQLGRLMKTIFATSPGPFVPPQQQAQVYHPPQHHHPNQPRPYTSGNSLDGVGVGGGRVNGQASWGSANGSIPRLAGWHEY